MPDDLAMPVGKLGTSHYFVFPDQILTLHARKLEMFAFCAFAAIPL